MEHHTKTTPLTLIPRFLTKSYFGDAREADSNTDWHLSMCEDKREPSNFKPSIEHRKRERKERFKKVQEIYKTNKR